jgi:hypothetical protein
MAEIEKCPKCEAQLPSRFSTGRLVCTKCGWSDRPDRPLHSNIPIMEQTLDAAENILEKVFPRDHNPNPVVKEIKSRDFLRGAGSIFFTIGLLTMMIGLFYDTSVRSESDYSFRRIVNTGFVSDRETITNIGGFLCICGAVFLSRPSGKQNS